MLAHVLALTGEVAEDRAPESVASGRRPMWLRSQQAIFLGILPAEGYAVRARFGITLIAVVAKTPGPFGSTALTHVNKLDKLAQPFDYLRWDGVFHPAGRLIGSDRIDGQDSNQEIPQNFMPSNDALGDRLSPAGKRNHLVGLVVNESFVGQRLQGAGYRGSIDL